MISANIKKMSISKLHEQPTSLLEVCTPAVNCDRFCRTGGFKLLKIEGPEI